MLHQFLARAFALGIGHFCSWQCFFSDHSPKGAGSLGTGKDKALHCKLFGQIQHVSRAMDIGAGVFRVLPVGEVIIPGKVDHKLHAAVAAQKRGKAQQLVALTDIHLQPAQIGV